jgi:hypothetical protein
MRAQQKQQPTFASIYGKRKQAVHSKKNKLRCQAFHLLTVIVARNQILICTVLAADLPIQGRRPSQWAQKKQACYRALGFTAQLPTAVLEAVAVPCFVWNSPV